MNPEPSSGSPAAVDTAAGGRPRLLVFGAGNIGRSFVGQVFSRSGWDLVFVDVDQALVAALNERRQYEIVIKRVASADESLIVKGLRAVDGRDLDAVAAEIDAADMAATAVGKAALPKILGALARGLERRWRSGGKQRPLDLIIAENDRDAAATIRSGLSALLPTAFPLGEALGLVETSIGKMVPIMRAADLEADRLRLFAEEYNSLIVARAGFLGPLPRLDDLVPVDDIAAWVDRKLFVHNLGHAAVAYLGYRADPSVSCLSQALALPGVREGSRLAMAQAARALALRHPAELDPAQLEEHIEDLLSRFANEALGDTVFRVGRDLSRKLGRSDRIVGATLLCEGQGLPWDAIALVFGAALGFRALDEGMRPFPGDAAFAWRLEAGGCEALLREVCGLDPALSIDAAVIRGLLAADRARSR